MKQVTRLFELPPGRPTPGEEYRFVCEWPGHLPVIPEGGMITTGKDVWRVRYVGVAIEEASETVVLSYTVEDAKRTTRGRL